MRTYKYFDNVKKNAVFTEHACQFCGSKNDCLEGVYFEKNNIESVCVECLAQSKTSVYIPDEIQSKIVRDRIKKVGELSITPPVAWVQSNEWPVCCDDYMKYIGEWEKTDFINQSSHEEYINYFKKLLDKKMLERIDDIETLIEDLGYDSVAYAFRCIYCNKITIVCQDY